MLKLNYFTLKIQNTHRHDCSWLQLWSERKTCVESILKFLVWTFEKHSIWNEMNFMYPKSSIFIGWEADFTRSVFHKKYLNHFRAILVLQFLQSRGYQVPMPKCLLHSSVNRVSVSTYLFYFLKLLTHSFRDSVIVMNLWFVEIVFGEVS